MSTESGKTKRSGYYRGFAILVGPKSMLVFKIGTHDKNLWFCKVHVLKSDDMELLYRNVGRSVLHTPVRTGFL